MGDYMDNGGERGIRNPIMAPTGQLMVTAQALQSQGLSYRQIGQVMGISRHTIRSWLEHRRTPRKVQDKKSVPVPDIAPGSLADFAIEYGVKIEQVEHDESEEPYDLIELPTYKKTRLSMY